MYERAQRGLHANGNEWINLQRLYDRGEGERHNIVTDGTSESQMRNQFRAWSKFMTMSL
jgi:benzoate/toluate 1,2-dioxygenase subunit alpha